MAKAEDQHTPLDKLSVADFDRILRLDIGLRDADALCEAQEMFERERLFLHWHDLVTGQEGDIPGSMWRNGSLQMARDPAPGAIDFATQRERIPRDEAFVQEKTANVPRGIRELTVSLKAVRAIWPVAQSYTADQQLARERAAHTSASAPSSTNVERPPTDANKTVHLEWAYGRLFETNRLAGLRGKALLKAVCDEVGPKFAAGSTSLKIAMRRYRERHSA